MALIHSDVLQLIAEDVLAHAGICLLSRLAPSSRLFSHVVRQLVDLLPRHVYVHGGFTYAPPKWVPECFMEHFDFVTTRWTSLSPVPYTVHSVAVAALDGHLYVCGGATSTSYESRAHRFIRVRNRWETLPDLQAPLANASAVAMQGLLYVTGGQWSDDSESDWPINLNVAERFDPDAFRWEILPSMSRRRSQHKAVPVGGNLYVYGGEYKANEDRFDCLLERLDASKVSWEALPPMLTSRHAGMMASSQTCIYMAGGLDISDHSCILNSVEQYSTDVQRWVSLSAMHESRYGAYMTVIDGNLYVCGGRGSSDLLLNSVERLNFVSGAWEILPPMLNRRVCAAGGVIGGKLFVFGGGEEMFWNTEAALSQVEYFDIPSSMWVAMPPMICPRGHVEAVIVVESFRMPDVGDHRSDGTGQRAEAFQTASQCGSHMRH